MVLGKDESDHCYDIDSSLRIHIDTVILCIYPDRYAHQANIGAYHGAYDVSAIYRSRPVLLILFSSEFGKALKELGFQVVFDVKGIVIAQFFVNFPYAMKMVKTAFMQVDRRLEIIAGMLGASKWKQLTTIILPLSRNALISMIVLVWSRAIGEFGATLMLVGITRMKTETLPGSIYLSISTGDTEMAMAAATIMLCIAMISLTVINRLNTTPKYSG